MSIKYHETDMSLVINLEGEMTASNSISIREEITGQMEQNEKNLLINLEDVSYVDSTGLGLLVALHATLRSSNKKMAIIGVSNTEIKKLFAVTQLSKFFKICDTIAEAERDLC